MLGHRVAILRGMLPLSATNSSTVSPTMRPRYGCCRHGAGCVGGELQHRLRHALTIDDHDAAIPVREFPVLISQGAGLTSSSSSKPQFDRGSG